MDPNQTNQKQTTTKIDQIKKNFVFLVKILWKGRNFAETDILKYDKKLRLIKNSFII